MGSVGWLRMLVSARRGGQSMKLCPPGASVEAVGLYQFLNDISGRHTQSGQPCAPLLGGDLGKTPVGES